MYRSLRNKSIRHFASPRSLPWLSGGRETLRDLSGTLNGAASTLSILSLTQDSFNSARLFIVSSGDLKDISHCPSHLQTLDHLGENL